MVDVDVEVVLEVVEIEVEMEINIDIDRNRERRRLRPRQLYSYSLLPPLQALREGGVEGAVEGLAPTERRLPTPECLVGVGGEY